MLTKDDLSSFRGATIIDAEIRTEGDRQVLRLRRSDGNIVAVEAIGDALSVSDETSIPWGS